MDKTEHNVTADRISIQPQDANKALELLLNNIPYTDIRENAAYIPLGINVITNQIKKLDSVSFDPATFTLTASQKSHTILNKELGKTDWKEIRQLLWATDTFSTNFEFTMEPLELKDNKGKTFSIDWIGGEYKKLNMETGAFIISGLVHDSTNDKTRHIDLYSDVYNEDFTRKVL